MCGRRAPRVRDGQVRLYTLVAAAHAVAICAVFSCTAIPRRVYTFDILELTQGTYGERFHSGPSSPSSWLCNQVPMVPFTRGSRMRTMKRRLPAASFCRHLLKWVAMASFASACRYSLTPARLRKQSSWYLGRSDTLWRDGPLMQTDLKKLIAYSSVSHLGFVTLASSRHAEGLDGAMMQMFSHAW